MGILREINWPGVFPIDEHEEGGIEGWQEDGEEDLVEKILLKNK